LAKIEKLETLKFRPANQKEADEKIQLSIKWIADLLID
jgi:hypothetical protein